ncbi:DUF2062 domain-containing protein [Planctomycetaceae bacterium SH139]
MKPLRRRLQRIYLRLRRFITHNLLHADDPPHRLALGVAIGMFFAFTPLIGVQMVLVVAAAWVFRANKAVGVPLVWISNPATFVPIFYPCYLIGNAILGWPLVSRQWWAALADPPVGFIEGSRFYWARMLEIFAPLMLGSIAVALPLAIMSYLVTRTVIERYRARGLKKWRRRNPPSRRLNA